MIQVFVCTILHHTINTTAYKKMTMRYQLYICIHIEPVPVCMCVYVKRMFHFHLYTFGIV